MRFVFIALWTLIETLFLYSFLSLFSKEKNTKKTTVYILLGTWFFNLLLSLFNIGGIYNYLIYLLVSILIILMIFNEYSIKGIEMFIFSFLIPFIIDIISYFLVREFEGILYYLIITIGKLTPLLIVYLLKKFTKNYNKKVSKDIESLLLKQHIEMQQESMNALEQNYKIQRKSTHEFEHHLQVLNDLFEKKEYDTAKDYIYQLKKNRTIHTISVSSGHPIIDVILNQKYQTAMQYGIKMQIRVNQIPSMSVSAESLVVILTNLLDNAIEACIKIDGYKEIICSIIFEEGLYIMIKNTSKPVSILNGQIPTSKEDSLSHGFGLLSVKYKLDELNAEYTFGYENGWFYISIEC